MSRHYFTFAAAAAAALMAFGPAAEAQTVLRYAEYSGSEGIRPESLRWFDEQLRARTDGRYAMQIHWAGSLLGARDIYSGVRDGVADMGVASAAYTPQELYASTVADVPEFPVDFYGGTRALLDFLTSDPEAQMFMEDANIVPVSLFPSGPFQLLCNGDVNGLDDLAGKRIRGVASMIPVINGVGASLVSLPITESFQALDSGLIDCTATFDVSIRAYRQHEAVTRYVEINYGNLSSNILAINKDIFESMAAEDQEILLQLGRDYIDDYSARIAAESAAIRETMRTGAEGPEVTFVQLSDEEHARIIELAAEYTDGWRTQAGNAGIRDPQAMLDRWLVVRERHHAQIEAEGYPWD
ncbi:MAG TPA: TRAP transporter substrate-binding protein DctP [Paracoccus sp.]|nr:TRAP transporter substrate-binding protein DctP [Paracoccus sp. (in: a-proteobacteria)]